MHQGYVLSSVCILAKLLPYFENNQKRRAKCLSTVIQFFTVRNPNVAFLWELLFINPPQTMG